MGIVEGALIASAIVGTKSYLDASEARSEQAANLRRSAEEQRKVQSEQAAANAASSASERRQQLRQARVQRARVMQAATNTGVSLGSGEAGALGGISTGLLSNIGANLGSLQTAKNINAFAQTAADFGTSASQSAIEAQNSQSLFQLSSSIFSSFQGPQTIAKAMASPSTSVAGPGEAGWGMDLGKG